MRERKREKDFFLFFCDAPLPLLLKNCLFSFSFLNLNETRNAFYQVLCPFFQKPEAGGGINAGVEVEEERREERREVGREIDSLSLPLHKFSNDRSSFNLSLSLSTLPRCSVSRTREVKRNPGAMRRKRGGRSGRAAAAAASGKRAARASATFKTKRFVAAVAFVALALVALDALSTPALAQQQQTAPAAPAGGFRENRSVTVRDVDAFRSALDDDSVSEIMLADAGRVIDLDGAAAFPVDGPPAVIGPGRVLVVRSAYRTTPASLNFTGGPTPAIVVARDAALVFSQLLLTSGQPPSADEARRPPRGIVEHYAVPQLGIWPSVSLEPGSEVRREGREKERGRSTIDIGGGLSLLEPSSSPSSSFYLSFSLSTSPRRQPLANTQPTNNNSSASSTLPPTSSGAARPSPPA